MTLRLGTVRQSTCGATRVVTQSIWLPPLLVVMIHLPRQKKNNSPRNR
jgi:hypothetical protein